MPANVETISYVRETPWHGLEERVEEALNSFDALHQAELKWTVMQRSILTDTLMDIPGFKANIRDVGI